VKLKPAGSAMTGNHAGLLAAVLAADLMVVADLVLTGLLAGWVLSATAQPAGEEDILPAMVRQAEPLPLARAPILRVTADGDVTFNGTPVPAEPGDLELWLARYRATAHASRIPPSLVVRPDPATSFDALAPILQACADAHITTVRLMY